MEMLRKIIDCESLENFPRNVYDGAREFVLIKLQVRVVKLQLCYNRYSPQILIRICSKKSYFGLHHRGFPACSLQDRSLKNFGKVSERYLCHSLSNKNAGRQSLGCFTEKEVFDKDI